MTRLTLLAALALGASPALALTPDELYASWQARAADFGATLSATAVPEGDALVLRDMVVTLEGEEASDPLPIPVTLRPQADGSVAIEVPIPAFQDIPGDPMAGTPAMRVEQTGATITAREGAGGAGGPVDYEVAAETVRYVTLPGVDEPAGNLFDIAVEMVGLRATFSDRPDAAGVLRTGLAAEGIAYILDMTDAFVGQTSGATRLDGFSLDVTTTLPAGFDLMAFGDVAPAGEGLAFAQALADGLAMRIDFASGATEGSATATGGMFDYEYSITGGEAAMSLSLDAAGIAVTAEGGVAEFTGSSPLLDVGTIEATMGPYDMDVRVGLGPEPAPFRYRVNLEEVSISDAAWDAFDPERALPRGPGRFTVDVTGTAALDLMAMMEAEAAYAEPPIPAIESLEIAALDVAAAGARLTGTGAFTFEPDEFGTPVPAGTATVTLEGANRLLDALVAMGVVPASDASDARMGLAMAFNPGEGEDVLTSTVETREDGSVIVNGQKFQ